MNLTDPQRLLVTDVLAVGAPYRLALTGECAVQVHGLVERSAQEVGVATESPAAMEEIADAVRVGLEERGRRVRVRVVEPLSARLIVTDPGSGEESVVDVLKEAFWHPPVQTEYGPVLALEDVVGIRVRALADRGLAGDLVDVRGAADRWSNLELEELGRRHALDTLDLADLQARLTGTDWIADAEFTAYGLDDQDITDLRRWAQQWADDIGERLLESAEPEDC